MKKKLLCASLALAFAAPSHAADSDEIAQLRRDIAAMKSAYEARIDALEKRLEAAEAHSKAAEANATAATTAAAQATATANQAAAAQPAAPAPVEAPAAVASGAPSSGNSFNPEISLILSGLYTNTQRDPANYSITGFPVGSDTSIGPGDRGFSLAESELGIAANIDP